MKFPCTGCGACCRVINRHEGLIVTDDPTNPYYFPYKWDDTGKCENLVDDKCKIYESRPLICNIDAFIDALGLERKEFHAINIEVCNKLVDEFGLDEKLKPRIEIQGSF